MESPGCSPSRSCSTLNPAASSTFSIVAVPPTAPFQSGTQISTRKMSISFTPSAPTSPSPVQSLPSALSSSHSFFTPIYLSIPSTHPSPSPCSQTASQALAQSFLPFSPPHLALFSLPVSPGSFLKAISLQQDFLKNKS